MIGIFYPSVIIENSTSEHLPIGKDHLVFASVREGLSCIIWMEQTTLNTYIKYRKNISSVNRRKKKKNLGWKPYLTV